MMDPRHDTRRRLHPRIFDTDWLVLRELTGSLERLISHDVRDGDTVLDFGCGDMPYRSLVEQRGATYLGADFGDEADACIRDDGSLVVEDASVDVVISIQVLEHVRHLDRYFAEISRVLRPGGVLLLSTHGTWLYHPHPEDHRRWTRVGLINDIECRGFQVRQIEAMVGPMGTSTLIRLTGYAMLLRRVPLIGRLLAGALATVMNARAWAEELATPQAIRFDNGCVYMTRCERQPA